MSEDAERGGNFVSSVCCHVTVVVVVVPLTAVSRVALFKGRVGLREMSHGLYLFTVKL